MLKEKAVAGFIGAGGIARSHAYSLNSLPYFYNDAPEIVLEAVCSSSPESRMRFSKRFGIEKSLDIEAFVKDRSINTVFILSPNKVHYKHLKAVIQMGSVDRIYLEKPVCSTIEEEMAIRTLVRENPAITIQVGFQFLFTAAIRDALAFWKSGKLGNPLHFDLKYYHGDYLQKDYRNLRQSRLTAAPEGGAMADLGSHAISLLLAFIGNDIHVTGALQAGSFSDVTADSDLYSLISLYDAASKAVGTLSASRISSGTGDSLSIELFAEKGALRYSSVSSEYWEYYSEETGVWTKQMVGSDFRPVSNFPSVHVPAGWLRSMIHAHYVFLTGNDPKSFVPDIDHGLEVQRLVRQTAERLKEFRNFKPVQGDQN